MGKIAGAIAGFIISAVLGVSVGVTVVFIIAGVIIGSSTFSQFLRDLRELTAKKEVRQCNTCRSTIIYNPKTESHKYYCSNDCLREANIKHGISDYSDNSDAINPCSTCANLNTNHCTWYAQRKPDPVSYTGCSNHSRLKIK